MARPGADARLRRLLAMVPWIAANNGPRLDDVCARFGVSRDELLEDLELLPLCGVPPYSADRLIEAEVWRGQVWIRFADYFARPLRLTPAEALGLVAAGAGLLATPGTDPAGPLARALEKLRASLGLEGDDPVEVTLGSVDHDVLHAMRTAAEQHRLLALDYYAYGRDALTSRVVEPYRVFNADGQWYLFAYCRTVEGTRLFRADRVRDLVLREERFDPPTRIDTPPLYSPRADDPTVTLDVGTTARWVAEEYPNEGVEELEDGRCRVRLRVSERAWLERLLLVLGPDARVVDGAGDVVREAAARILDRYRRPVR